MHKIGIIALEEERVSSLKWFDFFKYKIVERFYLEAYDVEAIVFYAGAKPGKIYPMLSSYGVDTLVYTRLFKEKFGNFEFPGVKNTNGRTVYRKLIPSIVKKVTKISGIDISSGTIAITEENPEIALSLVEKLSNDFRYITVVSGGSKRASAISETILENLGLPIIISDIGSKVKCDIAVKTGTRMPNLPKHAILIDAGGEHTISRKNSIDWVEVSTFHNLPYMIDSLSFVEAVELAKNENLDCRINAFKCASKVVPSSRLKAN
ncbi:MAG: hypothetical protein PHF89_02210 [Eubacteriales bacterium]|nr:hypothetical protein [Eubacteriales bacterium]